MGDVALENPVNVYLREIVAAAARFKTISAALSSPPTGGDGAGAKVDDPGPL